MKDKMTDLCTIARGLDIPFGDSSAPEENHVTANGVGMHYLDWGHSDKPVILFLHGAGLTAHTWDLVCLSLREDYHCIALDQRGHGLTDGFHLFGVDEPREDIRAFAAALGLEHFALVGMSLGGNNAIAYGGIHSDNLAAAVFIDVCPSVLPSGYQDALDFEEKVSGSESLDAAVAAAAGHNPRGTVDYKKYTMSFSLEQRDDGRWHFRYHREQPPGRSKEEGAAYMAWRRETLWSLVPNISCPALIVHGVESKAQNRDNLANFQDKLPDAGFVEISGAGHDVQEDQPAALISALKAFLQRIGY